MNSDNTKTWFNCLSNFTFNLLILFNIFRCYRHRCHSDLHRRLIPPDVFRQPVLDWILPRDVLALQTHGTLGVLLRAIQISVLPVPETVRRLPLHIQPSKWTPYWFFGPSEASNWAFIVFQEYYVIREWLLPGWMMFVQALVTLALILSLFCQVVLALVCIRWPLRPILRYEWMCTGISFVCTASASKLNAILKFFDIQRFD